MDLVSEKFNGREYTLVEVYTEKDKIYHFLSDDKEIFCLKKEEKYVVIKDKTYLKEIKQKYGFIDNKNGIFYTAKPILVSTILGVKGVKNADKKQKNEIVNSTFEKLSKLFPEEKLDKMKRRLQKVKLYLCEDWRISAEGWYHPATDGIFLLEGKSAVEYATKNETIFHECMHAILGKKFGFDILSQGINEGIADSITEKVFDNGTSTKGEKLAFNFSNRTYMEQISLIRQMQYAIGTSDIDMLKNPYKFLEDFSQKYGRDTCRLIKHTTRRLIHSKNMEAPEEYFSRAQDIVLVKIFDKDFENVKDVESAKKYLERLQNFELVRGDMEGNNFFEKYYDCKKSILREKFIEQGIPSEYIDLHLKNYKKSVFKNRYTSQDLEEESERLLTLDIANDREYSQDADYKCFVADIASDKRCCMVMKNEEVLKMTQIDVDNIYKVSASCCEISTTGLKEEKVEPSYYYKTPDGNRYEFKEFKISEKGLEHAKKLAESKQKNRINRETSRIRFHDGDSKTKKVGNKILSKISGKIKDENENER